MSPLSQHKLVGGSDRSRYYVSVCVWTGRDNSEMLCTDSSFTVSAQNVLETIVSDIRHVVGYTASATNGVTDMAS